MQDTSKSAVHEPSLLMMEILDKLPERSRIFYLEGINCAGCVHSIESIPRSVDGIKRLKLNFARSLLEVELDENGRFTALGKELLRLGYTPRAIESDPEINSRKENRKDLVRIGVAGACAGNIMLLTVSLYGGASGETALGFAWLSLLLSLPVLLYAALPFYQTSLSALRQKRISIDFPIVMALIAGFVASVMQLLHHKTMVYFDSLTMLVFLLLSSRYFLKRIQQKQFSTNALLRFFKSPFVKRIAKEGAAQEITVDTIKPGDIIEVANGSQFPVDGIITNGRTHIDMSLLTGEAEPVSASMGDCIYAGTTNLSQTVLVEADKTAQDSRLGKILDRIDNAAFARTPLSSFADSVGRYFSVCVSLLSLFIIFYFRTNLEEGFQRALALIIVSCPCVLALAIPLVNSLAISLAAKRGSLIKNSEALEKITKVNTIFLDKTGTLTEGHLTLEKIDAPQEQRSEIESIILALEKSSRHPIAKAIVKSLSESKTNMAAIDEWQEQIGIGVSGRYKGSLWQIKADSSAAPHQIGKTLLTLNCNGRKQAALILSDSLRKDSARCVELLKQRKLHLQVISGDRKENVEDIASRLGICSARGQLNPEEKASIVENAGRSLMIGDGANDAIALKRAFLGIAVHGSMEMSLNSADIYISKPGLSPIVDLFVIAEESKKIILRNFSFSFFYNMVGASLAVLGYMNPLWAALIMPISASTVFASSLWGTKNLRRLRGIAKTDVVNPVPLREATI